MVCAFAALTFEWSIASGQTADAWPGRPFATVRAFAWPANDHEANLVQPDLTPVPGAIDPSGKLLTAAQAARLIAAATRPSPPGRINISVCFEPHHAFIFYDDAGRPIAAVELSIRYRGFRILPELPDREPHYGDLASLCQELGLPFHGHFSLADYRAEFEDIYVKGAGFEGAD